MPSSKKHRRRPLIFGCGCHPSSIFFPTKDRPPSSPTASPSPLLPAASSTDDAGPSFSSSVSSSSVDNFPTTTTTAVASDEPDPYTSFSGLLRELNDMEQTLLSLPAVSSSKPMEQLSLQLSPQLSPLALSSPAAFSSGIDGIRSQQAKSGTGGVAVVKNSEDPLTDFRRSMLQMIAEQEIVTIQDLKDLLHCFLSLNSPHHHDIILRAFLDVWEIIFSGDPDAQTHWNNAHRSSLVGVLSP